MRYADAITARKVPAPVETKTDPFSLTSLIAWLETMPAKEDYCYADNGRCLLASYFTARGFNVHGVGPTYIRFSKDRWEHTPLPRSFEDISAEEPWTFGAALARARKLAATY